MFRSQKQRPWFEMDSSSITLFFATPCEALTTHPGVTKVGAAAHHFCLSSGALEGFHKAVSRWKAWLGVERRQSPLFPCSALQGQEHGGRRGSAFPGYIGKFSAWLSRRDCS